MILFMSSELLPFDPVEVIVRSDTLGVCDHQVHDFIILLVDWLVSQADVESVFVSRLMNGCNHDCVLFVSSVLDEDVSGVPYKQGLLGQLSCQPDL